MHYQSPKLGMMSLMLSAISGTVRQTAELVSISCFTFPSFEHQSLSSLTLRKPSGISIVHEWRNRRFRSDTAAPCAPFLSALSSCQPLMCDL